MDELDPLTTASHACMSWIPARRPGQLAGGSCIAASAYQRCCLPPAHSSSIFPYFPHICQARQRLLGKQRGAGVAVAPRLVSELVPRATRHGGKGERYGGKRRQYTGTTAFRRRLASVGNTNNIAPLAQRHLPVLAPHVADTGKTRSQLGWEARTTSHNMAPKHSANMVILEKASWEGHP